MYGKLTLGTYILTGQVATEVIESNFVTGKNEIDTNLIDGNVELGWPDRIV